MSTTERWVIWTDNGYILGMNGAELLLTQNMEEALHFGEFKWAWEWMHRCLDLSSIKARVEYTG